MRSWVCDGRRSSLSRRTARLADTKTVAPLRPLSEAACALMSAPPGNCDVVFASRSGEPIVGYRKMWLRIAKLGDLEQAGPLLNRVVP